MTNINVVAMISKVVILHLHNCRVGDFQLCKWFRVKLKLRMFRWQLSRLALLLVHFCDGLGVGDGLDVGGGLARATVGGEDEKGAVERPAQDQPSLHRDARHIVVRVQTWEVEGNDKRLWLNAINQQFKPNHNQLQTMKCDKRKHFNIQKRIWILWVQCGELDRDRVNGCI